MNIRIVCIGKLKEKYWTDAVSEYSKRIKRFSGLEIVELKESLLPANASPKDEEKVKEEEAKEILKVLKKDEYVITLEIKGKPLSSEELASKVANLALEGHPDIAFVIGGSLGLGAEVSKRANFKLSFSGMTFPHQLMRVILLEQIYRSFKINNNETYHK
ncbi:MAG: 23S rRNA (pseudouridine(1915)-N(3))-methyltransferase RlmH [Firmicutes bacterium]|nr:23S rRNA (pseudouridine(1915)-N(3))-methyltransferase RlmH [Bacillota bacterium]